MSAVAIGCPFAISADDIDVEDLSSDDFVESPVPDLTSWWGSSEISIDDFSTGMDINLPISYFIQLVKLSKVCKFVHLQPLFSKHKDDFIMRTQYSASNAKSPTDHMFFILVGEKLKEWKVELPSSLRLDTERKGGWTSQNMYPLLLRIVYERAVALHYRPLCYEGHPWHNICTTTEAHMRNFDSAIETIRLFELLLQNELLLFCPDYTYELLFV